MSQNTSFLTQLSPPPYPPLPERSGKLPFTLTNDYMFKVVFQTDETVLRALLCSLLDSAPEDICSIAITNALVPGATIESKDTILDIRLILNNNRIVNLEMQLKNEHDWPERSLCYLCRAFDNLGKGASYTDVTPAHHIGILNFSLPHVQKQFYSHYYMINETTQEIFSDKLRLSVLNLTQTALATDHDRQSGLTRWAAAFKAKTWEEFQMLAEEDSIFKKVSDALYLISENREVAEQCRRMQEAEARQMRLKKLEEEYVAHEEKYKAAIAEHEAVIAKHEAVIAEHESTIAEHVATIAEHESTIAEQENTIVEQENTIAEQENTIAEKDHALAEQNNLIAQKDAELERLRAQLHSCRKQSRHSEHG